MLRWCRAETAPPRGKEIRLRQVQSPLLVGREPELAFIDTALGEAISGQGRVVIVTGEAGIGKSRFARAVEDMAHRRALKTTRGRATQASRHIPYRPFAEATQAILRDDNAMRLDPELAPFRAALRHLVPEWSAQVEHADDSGLLIPEAILRVLRRLSPRGLVLVLEDLHWADEDTLAAIEYLADNVATERVLCVVTERSDEARSDRLATLVARRAASSLPLGPLPTREIEEMARACLNTAAIPDALAATLQRRSEGNPFLVEEIIAAYLAHGDVEDEVAWLGPPTLGDALPWSYRELVAERLAALPRDARRVVMAAAVLGRTFDRQLLAPIVDLPMDDVLEALRAGVRSRLVSGTAGAHASEFHFRHALIREAILAELLPSELSELCERAARAIEDTYPGLPGEWCERAADLRERSGDRLGACRLLQESARRALLRSALSTAEGTLMRARRLASDDHMAWIGVDELLFEALLRAGKHERLLELSRSLIAFMRAPRTARATGEGEVSQISGYIDVLARPRIAQLHLNVARASLLLGDLEHASASLEAARVVAADDPAVNAPITTVAARLALEQGRVADAVELASATAHVSALVGDVDLELDALDTLAQVHTRSGDFDAAKRTYVSIEQRARRNAGWRARALLLRGSIECVERGDSPLLGQARTIATDIGAVSLLVAIDLETARSRLGRGEFAEARTSIDRALDAARRYRLGALPIALVTEAALFALTQDAREMDRRIADALADGRSEALVRSLALGEARAVYLLLRGERARAQETLEEAFAHWKRTATTPPWFAGLWALVAAVERRDELRVRDEVRASGAAGNPQVAAYLAYAAAIAAARGGAAQDAQRELDRGSGLFTHGWRYHHARMLVADAALADKWGDPASWARDALGFFDQLGTSRAADAARAIMRRAGAPVPRKGRGDSTVPAALVRLGVTSREMDVLAQVAKGLGNTAIGAQLYVSPRTIESHVTSLMRKLGVDSRAGLISRLGELTGPARESTPSSDGEAVP